MEKNKPKLDDIVGTTTMSKGMILGALDYILVGINNATDGVVDRTVTKGTPEHDLVDRCYALVNEEISKLYTPESTEWKKASALLGAIYIGGAMAFIDLEVKIDPPENFDKPDEAERKANEFIRREGIPGPTESIN